MPAAISPSSTHHPSSPPQSRCVRARRSWRGLVGGLVVALMASALAGLSSAASAAPDGVPPSGTGGTITAWGGNGTGQTNLPGSLDGKTVTAVAAGGYHTLALIDDGTITAWGYNSEGQSTVPGTLDGKTATAVAAGDVHSLALTDDGTVTAWGANSQGQSDVPGSLDGKTVTAIAAGFFHSLALTDDGTITGWGNDGNTQSTPPGSLDGKTVTAISAGGFHSLALTDDGTVTAWGNDNYGQGTVPGSLDGKTVTAIGAGTFYNVALTDDGAVTAWGQDDDGQSTVPGSLDGENVTAIAAGWWHSLALTDDGTVTAWGRNDAGQATVPASLDGRTVTALSAGNYHSVAIVAPSAPEVTGIAPAAGPRAGGTEVVITGTDFTGTTRVLFGSAGPASSYTVDSPTQITAVSPPSGSVGRRNIRVTTPAGTSPAVAADWFTYTSDSPPAITEITPSTGPRTGGTEVVITGTDLTDTNRVLFGSTGPATSFTINSSTQITAVAPTSGSVGRRHLRIRTPEGTSPAAPTDLFTYTSDTSPGITSITPTGGPQSGGTEVVITGTHLLGATRVLFGAAGRATSYTIDSPTQITATAPPAGATGRRHLRITTPEGTSPPVPADIYTYN